MRVVTRAEWGATAKLGPPMTLPVGELWLHHSVTPLTDDAYADMKAIERVGVDRFGRYSYSWAYHAKHRLLLEGAGNTVGAHTDKRNSTSLGLVLIGDYTNLTLSDDNVADLRWAIQWLISGNRLKAGTYPTGGHRDLKSTACPGINAYGRIHDIRVPAPTQEDDEVAKQIVWYEPGHAYVVRDGFDAKHLPSYPAVEFVRSLIKAGGGKGWVAEAAPTQLGGENNPLKKSQRWHAIMAFLDGPLKNV